MMTVHTDKKGGHFHVDRHHHPVAARGQGLVRGQKVPRLGSGWAGLSASDLAAGAPGTGCAVFSPYAPGRGAGNSHEPPPGVWRLPPGVYILTDWIRGRDAEAVLPSLPQKGQYAYGLDAGRILKKIHSIPAPADVIPWSEYFNRKIDRKLVSYAASSLKYDGGEAFLTFITQNRHLLSDRPQTYQHGDYHIGNMMVDDHGVLTIIDFEKDDYGDPWEEFNRIVWCAQAAPAFAAGMVDGYFDGTVPMEFWRLLALYICSNTLGSLPWAIPFGEEEIQVMRRQAAQVLQWYNGMTNVVPTWYHT